MNRSLIQADDSRWTHRWYGGLTLALMAGFLWATHVFWAPAHPGVDQNGYLVGGRMMADHGSTSFAPRLPGTGEADPYRFVGMMWIGADLNTPAERYYPKYPIGLPALVALLIKIGGPGKGFVLAYWISPVCMMLSLGAMYLLVRLAAGPLVAFLCTLLLACSPVTLGLVNNPNSHASTLCCVTWGMWLVLRWWRRDHHCGWSVFVWALLGAFLLGYAVTIRYTEGLLVVPLLLVVAFGWRGWRQGLMLLLAWAAPVGALVIYNLRAFGALTGYDPTNESTGFSWDYFVDNWEPMLRQIETVGLFAVLPLAVLGLGLLLTERGLARAARAAGEMEGTGNAAEETPVDQYDDWIFRWRLAVVLIAWAAPSMLLYTAYYWAPDSQFVNVGYLRFFLTVFPPLLMAGAALIRTRALQMGFAVLIGLAALVSLQGSTTVLESEYRGNLTTWLAGQEVMRHVPARAVLFTDQRNLLQHLQFTADYTLYTGEVFNRTYIQNQGKDIEFDDPQILQPQRRQAIYERLKDFTQPQLDELQRGLMAAAMKNGQEVYYLLSRRPQDERAGPLPASNPSGGKARRPNEPLARILGTQFRAEVVASWTAPVFPVKKEASKTRMRRGRPPVASAMREGNWTIVRIVPAVRKPADLPTGG